MLPVHETEAIPEVVMSKQHRAENGDEIGGG
jgi:hypothetical protein